MFNTHTHAHIQTPLIFSIYTLSTCPSLPSRPHANKFLSPFHPHSSPTRLRLLFSPSQILLTLYQPLPSSFGFPPVSLPICLKKLTMNRCMVHQLLPSLLLSPQTLLTLHQLLPLFLWVFPSLRLYLSEEGYYAMNHYQRFNNNTLSRPK